jgi:molybdenum cofactor cytidylyltransferase
MIRGIVLAAGRSRRMGQPKALLPVAGATFLQQAVATLQRGGCQGVTVVVRASRDIETLRIAAAARECGADVVENPVGALEQIHSLRTGLAALAPEVEATVVVPVDFPGIRVGVVAALIDAFRRTGAPLVVPVHRGQRGHPALFARRVFADLMADPLSEGARSVVHAHADSLVEVPVDEAGVLHDVDTPADYRRIVGHGA